MSLPKIVSNDEWLDARKKLLADEKKMTKARDRLNTKRRNLPMVNVEKDYVFEGPDGKRRLLDLFDGHRQLIVQHFMFDPSWDEGSELHRGRRRDVGRTARPPAQARDQFRRRLARSSRQDRALQGQEGLDVSVV